MLLSANPNTRHPHLPVLANHPISLVPITQVVLIKHNNPLLLVAFDGLIKPRITTGKWNASIAHFQEDIHPMCVLLHET